jgi:hypothetical protein
MGKRAEEYRARLKGGSNLDAYLKANSGLPGPRANLELVAAVGDVADAATLWRLSGSDDEFLALCGTAGLGRLEASDPVKMLGRLRQLASDPRWRVREGVALALQRMGRADMPGLITKLEPWVAGSAFVQRAAVAGLCEPPLLRSPADVKRVLRVLDRVTRSMAGTRDRHEEGFKALRKALGYCWSVAVAASPEAGRPLFEKWLRSEDPDVAWVMKTNLGKARMAALGKAWPASATRPPVSNRKQADS